MKRYNPKEIEPKLQTWWDETGTYTTDLNSTKPKYIAMGMFNYPSGNLHIGHAMNFTISDVKARTKRQQGFESYHPVGWDSFGLPAENRAIKEGMSPQESMAQLIPGYRTRYKAMGWSNDWEKEIATHKPEYYKWTQWIFSEMYRNGLAYQDARMQWWCAKDNTVLANEQVIDGKCWRHDSPDDPLVEKREIKQWFFKITDYADELLEAIEGLDWTDSVKLAQKNWIGKSKGAEIEFMVGQTYQAKDSLKFRPELTELVQTGEKTVTFRVEPKELAEGDYVKLITRFSPTETRAFGIGRITQVKAVRLTDLPLDYAGHEPFASVEERLADFRKYYGDSVTGDTEVYVYHFEKVTDIVTVFTTRPDTLYGATFMVLAPEHPVVDKITTQDRLDVVQAYRQAAAKKTEVERQEAKEKTGEFTGAYAINPVNGEKLPIWVADYVLVGYGTGAIMAVPAHDERDFEFAQKFDLPVRQVIAERFMHTDNQHQPDAPLVPRDVVCMVVKHPSEEKFLIAKPTGSDFWSPVMGGIDDGETPEDAAKRELLEESGYTDVKSIEMRGPVIASEFYAQHKGVNRIAYVQTVVIQLGSLEQQAVSVEEQAAQELKWATKDEVARLCVGAGAKEIYEFANGVVRDMVHEGRLVNSGDYNGVLTEDAREKIVADLAAEGVAAERTNYRMRDWSVSRQRYWGAPIPIIHCPKDGPVLVPDEQLPVVLPELDDFAPTGDGRSALARAKDWLEVECPQCGGPAERETDTLDTYIDSSWYMYRYFDPHNQQRAFDPEIVKKWEPIDFYNGADHATAHLLYARFIGHFFKKLGLVDEPEPFKQFLFNGKITASDGQMFSKSKGNGIDPLEIIDRGYGADALRTYLMFAAPLEIWARWDPQGVPGTYRFLNRVWNLVQEYTEAAEADISAEQQRDIRHAEHSMIRKMTEDLEANRYNTAIAAAMTCVNDFYKLKTVGFGKHEVWHQALISLVACVAPFAPHVSEELWHDLGHSTSVHRDTWPTYDEQYLAQDTVTVVVQVNGKLRGTIQAPADSDQAAVTELAHGDAKIAANLDSREVVKVIYVPGKLLNFVVK